MFKKDFLQGQSQNTVLVDYLLSLQYGIQNYYDSMSSTFRDFRNLLSGYLVQLNTAGVTEVTEGKISQRFKIDDN